MKFFLQDMARQVRPETLRAKYGKTKVQNAIHCSDLPEDGLLEVEYFFKILAEKWARIKWSGSINKTFQEFLSTTNDRIRRLRDFRRRSIPPGIVDILFSSFIVVTQWREKRKPQKKSTRKKIFILKLRKKKGKNCSFRRSTTAPNL